MVIEKSNLLALAIGRRKEATAIVQIYPIGANEKSEIFINNCLVSNDEYILKETPERGIGLVFQDLSLFPHLNIKKVVLVHFLERSLINRYNLLRVKIGRKMKKRLH